ncbi:hypothetical protein EVG20_g5130 [Dentipellis fragilis]|uniref:IgA peptidase M64-domain-containing protein n=1 Tax=Dentipellis fragilis TaxID=205917 RepID=A0A4Y9YW49_9AGAM|nr:hypothetical protein EVG20_g5130 [Dentipellis fragilis]
MHVTVLLTLVVGALSLSPPLSRHQHVPQKPFELVLHREPETHLCNVVHAPRQTKPHRRLTTSQTYAQESKTVTRHDGKGVVEIVKVYAAEEELLWERLGELCDSGHVDASAFTSTVDYQEPPVAWLPEPDAEDQLRLLASTPGIDSKLCTVEKKKSPVPLSVRHITGSGHSANRVDLTFFSDGYLASEEDKFIQDVTRLVEEISGNQTFHTVAPLLNFWAAFSPSNEAKRRWCRRQAEGISTPFGLYRDGTELRALYYAKPEVARAACDSLGDRCDYPILIGNDPLYGGLGGEFVTITPSEVNGPLVLRHELGHSVIDVGEEYDGGFAYFGPNAGHDTNKPMPWAHWLTHDSNLSNDKLPRVERAVMPIQAYPWTLLNTTAPWKITFNSSGTYSRHVVRFSLSGLPEEDDIDVLFDGHDLEWTPKPGLGVDRWHYDIYRDDALSEGEHEIEFALRAGKREGIAQLCSVELLEFGSDEEFNATPGFYGVFPTFSEKNETSYRPTNEDCLMRLTTTPNFCSVCVEGLWLSLLSRVDPIDSIQTGCLQTDRGSWLRTLKVDLLPLGQFRAGPPSTNEAYNITWTNDGQILDGFANITSIALDDRKALGKYSVNVTFVTEEVRADPEGLLSSERKFEVFDRCH